MPSREWLLYPSCWCKRSRFDRVPSRSGRRLNLESPEDSWGYYDPNESIIKRKKLKCKIWRNVRRGHSCFIKMVLLKIPWYSSWNAHPISSWALADKDVDKETGLASKAHKHRHCSLNHRKLFSSFELDALAQGNLKELGHRGITAVRPDGVLAIPKGMLLYDYFTWKSESQDAL